MVNRPLVEKKRFLTLVMAIACGVSAANIYYKQPMLGIMEAAFPGHTPVIGLVQPPPNSVSPPASCSSSHSETVSNAAASS